MTALRGRISRRRWTAALLGTGALGGCAPRPRLLRVGSIVFPGYEHLFLARELGWTGDDWLRLVELPASTHVQRALSAGLLEAAQLTLDEVLSARSAHLDLVVLAVLDISRGSDAVYSRRPLALNQLAGLRVAVEEGAVGTLMLDGLLRAAALRPGDLRRVPTTLQGSARTFVQQPEVDLVVTSEPWASEIAAAGGQRLFDSSALGDLIVDVFVARRDALQTHASELRAALAALFKARALHAAHAAQLGQTLPPRLSEPMARRLGVAPAQVADAFKGLHLPDLAENRALLAPAGGLRSAAETLLAVMQRADLLRRETPRRSLLDGFARADFLPADEVLR